MNLSTVKNFVLITATALGLGSCNIDQMEFDNLDVQDITGEYVFPLGETTYTMRELIEDQEVASDNLIEDSDSFLTLLYSQTTSYSTEGDFVNIPNITADGIVTVPAAGPFGTDQLVDIPQTFSDFQYEPQGGEQINEVHYATGDITVTVNTSITQTINYSLEIVSTVDAGDNPVTLTGTIAGGGTDTQSQSLAGYRTILVSQGNDNNRFTVNFDANVNLPAGQSLTGTESLTFTISYQNQTFSLIYGLFGQDTVQVGNQTIDVSFFQDMGDEGIFFGNPKIRFAFDNTFGIPMGVDFSGTYGTDNTGNQTFLSGTITQSPLPEIEAAQAPGETQNSTFEINRSNSNLVNLLSTSPTQLVFDIAGISNANDVTVENFVQPGNIVNGTIELEIPMEIRLENLVQTIYVDLNNGIDINNVDSAYLRVVTVNELPFSGILEMEIQDVDSIPLYTISEKPILQSPFININGYVTDPGGSSIDIPLSQEGIDAFAVGEYLVLKVKLNTPVSLTSRDIFVKILANYTLNIKLGVGGKVNVGI